MHRIEQVTLSKNRSQEEVMINQYGYYTFYADTKSMYSQLLKRNIMYAWLIVKYTELDPNHSHARRVE